MGKKIAFSLELQGSQKLLTNLTKVELELAIITNQLLKSKKAIVQFNTATKEQSELLRKEGVDIDQLNQKFQILSTRQKDLKVQAKAANESVLEQAIALEKQAKAQEKATKAEAEALKKRVGPALKAQGVTTTTASLQGVKGSVKDLTNLDVKLKLVQTSLKQVKSAVVQYNSANKTQRDELKKNGVDIDVLNTKLRSLTTEEAKLREAVRQGNTALRQQSRELIAGAKGIPKDSLVGLRIEYQKLTNEFELLSKAQRKSTFGKDIQRKAAVAKKSIDSISFSIGNFRSNVGNYASAAKKFGASVLTSFGILGGAALVGAALKNVTKIILNFEQAVADLDSILGASQVSGSLDLMKLEAKELGAITAFSATQVVLLQTELAKLGFTALDISESTQGVIDFAIATGVKAPRAAKLAGSSIRAFGLDVTETNRVVSALSVATTVSALDFSKLETSISTVAPVAAKFGFSLESTVALLGTLADAGFDASSAGTALRNIFLKMADANGELAQTLGRPIKSLDDLAPAFQELTARGIDLAEAFEVTDKRSASAFLTLIQGSDTLLNLRDSVTGVNDELKIMIEKRMATLKGRVILLESAWEGLVLSFDSGEGIFTRVGKSFVDGTTAMLTNLKLINTEGISIFDKLVVTLETFQAGEGRTTARVLKNQERLRKSLKETVALNKQVKLDGLLKRVGTAFPSGVVSTLIRVSDEGLTPLSSNLIKVTRDTSELTEEVVSYLDTMNKLIAKQKELQETLSNTKFGTKEYKTVSKNLADINALIENIKNKAKDEIALSFKEGSLARVNAQLQKLRDQLNDIPVADSKELLLDIIKTEAELDNLNKTVEDYRTTLEKENVDLLSPEKRLKIYTEEFNLKRESDIQIANFSIKNEETLAKAIELININADKNILISRVQVLDETEAETEKHINKINKLTDKANDLEIDIKITEANSLIDTAAAQTKKDLREAFTDTEQLALRDSLVDVNTEISKLLILQKEGVQNDKDSLDTKDKILALTKKQVQLQAEVNTTVVKDKQDIDTSARAELLRIIPIFDPNDITKSLADYQKFQDALAVIEIERKIAHLEEDLEVEQAAENNATALYDIEKKISDLKVDLHKAANKKIIEDSEKTLKKQKELALANAKAVADALTITGKFLGESFFGAAEDAEEAQKEFLKGSLTVLENVLIAQASAYALALPDSVATFGLSGAARAVLMAGLIKGVFAIGKAAIGEEGMILGESYGYGGMLQSRTSQSALRQGTVLKGRSHRNGGEHMMVKGKLNEAQGGEAIIKVEATKKHRGLLSAINVDGGGKSFSADTDYWTNLLLNMPRHEQGTILGSSIPAPQLISPNNQTILAIAQIPEQDMDKLAEKLLISQEIILQQMVAGVVDKIIIGLDTTNRLEERQRSAQADAEI